MCCDTVCHNAYQFDPVRQFSPSLIVFSCILFYYYPAIYIQGDTKKRELLKNPTKILEIQEKNLLTEIEPLQLAF